MFVCWLIHQLDSLLGSFALRLSIHYNDSVPLLLCKHFWVKMSNFAITRVHVPRTIHMIIMFRFEFMVDF